MNLPAAPDYLNREGRRALATESTQGMGLPPVPYISIEGSIFQLVNADGATWQPPTMGPIWTQLDAAGNVIAAPGSPMGVYIDAVLVDINANMSKTYYAQAYNQGQQMFVPPDCWSDNGVAPSTNARTPQHENCAACPHNVWGSRVNALGNKVKACDDVKKMAFAIPALNSPATYLLRLKGSSHKHWAAYVEMLGKRQIGDRRLDPTDVVTRIYFEPGSVGIMNFHAVGLITREMAAIEDQIWQARSTDQLVGRNDRPRMGALPAPAAVPAALPSPPAAAPPQQVFTPPPQPAQAAPQPQPQAPTFTVPQQGAPQQGQPATAPATPAEPPRRRRRQAAAPAQTAPAAGPGAPAPFVQPAAPASTQQAPASTPGPATAASPSNPPGDFGIRPGAPTNPELDAALSAALAPLPPV